MKNIVAFFLAMVTILSLSACNTDPFPSEVSEYATKHEIELISAEKLKSNTVVGKDYVIYGTISRIGFSNYEKGSADLENMLSGVGESMTSPEAAERLKNMIEADLEGTMRYYISLVGAGISDSLSYEDWNFPSNMLHINKGDEVAFVITCQDGYSPGTYKYVIKEKLWENRHSETTIEEDHDSKSEST